MPSKTEAILGALKRLTPEGSGYTSVIGKPSVLEIPTYGRIEAKPIPSLQEAHEAYMKSIGKGGPEHKITSYPEFDEDLARRIAEAFGEMKHAPSDPKVKKAYDALIDETMAQLRKIEDTGLDIRFMKPDQPSPYMVPSTGRESPALGYVDIAENNRLYNFPTDQGFGSSDKFSSDFNPLMVGVGRIGDKSDAVANDAFRVVHDIYGHFAPGNPFFRHKGEERAFLEHSNMYSPEALPAMATETRGQNAMLNFGPHGEANRGASSADTVYSDQKVGIMPEWTYLVDKKADGGRVQHFGGGGKATLDAAKQALEDASKMRSVLPAPQRWFDEGDKAYKPFLSQFEPQAGGRYLEMRRGEAPIDITGQKVSNATISVGPDGKPQMLVSPDLVDETGTSGRGNAVTRTNLFKRSAGWNWVNSPEGYEDIPTLVSVQNRGQHYYSLSSDYPKGVELSRYPNGDEPRLKPTTTGNVYPGNEVGRINVRGQEHPVYDKLTIKELGLPVGAAGLMYGSGVEPNSEGFAMGGTAFRGVVEPRFAEGGLNKVRDDGVLQPANVKEWNDPTTFEKIRDFLASHGPQTGTGRPTLGGQQVADSIYKLLAYNPVGGVIDSAQRTQRSVNSGDYGEAAIDAIGMLPAGRLGSTALSAASHEISPMARGAGTLANVAPAFVSEGHEWMPESSRAAELVDSFDKGAKYRMRVPREFADGGMVPAEFDPNYAYGGVTGMDKELQGIAANAAPYAAGGAVKHFRDGGPNDDATMAAYNAPDHVADVVADVQPNLIDNQHAPSSIKSPMDYTASVLGKRDEYHKDIINQYNKDGGSNLNDAELAWVVANIKPSTPPAAKSESTGSDDFDNQLSRMRATTALKESGNNPRAIGKVIPSGSYAGDRAYGLYQVMGKNIPDWTEKALGRRMTPEEYLNDTDAQHAVYNKIAGDNLRKYGNIPDAVSVWASGRPLSGNQTRDLVSGVPTSGYVSDFMKRMGDVGDFKNIQNFAASKASSPAPATAEAAPAPVVSDEQKKAYADQISQMKQKQDDAETKQLQSMMAPTSGGDPLAAMKEHIKSVIQANQARAQVSGGSEQPQSQAAPAPAQQQPRRGGLWDVLKKYG